MAIIGKGIFGNVSGRIGDVQGSRWKGRDTLQAYNPKGNGVVTTKMLNQRAKFANCRNWLSIVRKENPLPFPIKVIKKIGFWASWVKATSYSFPTTPDIFGANCDIIGNGKLPRPTLVSCEFSRNFMNIGQVIVTFTPAIGANIWNMAGLLYNLDTEELVPCSIVDDDQAEIKFWFLPEFPNNTRLVAFVWLADTTNGSRVSSSIQGSCYTMAL
jgi:hypothetical protein